MAARRTSRRTAPAEPSGAAVEALKVLPGVGPKVAADLARTGVERPVALLGVLPRTYLDLRHPTPLDQWRPDSGVAVVCGGEFTDLREIPTRRRGLRLVRGTLDTGAGSRNASPAARLTCVWFNQPYIARRLPQGPVRVSGQLRRRKGGQIELHNPTVVEESEATVLPVYGRLGVLGPARVRRLVLGALELLEEELPDALPAALRARLDMLGLRQALRLLHDPPGDLPADEVDDLRTGRSPGHRRLLFDHLMRHQAGLLLSRGREDLEVKPDDRYRVDDRVRDLARELLPFKLTGAQRRVVREVVDDLRGRRPCRRLIQGDVGSGKTIVAVLAALVAAESGLQVAVMAPTEVLAEQLYNEFVAHLPGHLEVRKITGATPVEERELTGPQAPRVAVGTQALLGESVRFGDLGLLVIDEQHRFGVSQRAALARQWPAADVLIMTATPIPRSLALFLYGELDLSTIDELPEGRQPVRTRVAGSAERGTVLADLRGEIEAGGRAFVVFPRIREGETSDGGSVASLEGLEALYRRELDPYRCAVLTGEVEASERVRILDGFRRGDIACLLSTTVVEVGVDVPEASVMVVEGAERFGLAQLHQLRGRVGRGGRASWCVALHEAATAEGLERLETFARLRDGFELAEADLRLRGPGQLLGTEQSGLGDGLWCRALDERELVSTAREVARELWQAEPARRNAWLSALGLSAPADREGVE